MGRNMSGHGRNGKQILNGRCIISLRCLFSDCMHMLAACVIKHACVICTVLYTQEIPEVITAPNAFNSYIRLASLRFVTVIL